MGKLERIADSDNPLSDFQLLGIPPPRILQVADVDFKDRDIRGIGLVTGATDAKASFQLALPGSGGEV